MRIPRSLYINKKRWQVTQSSEELDTQKYDGMCILDHYQILIDPDLSRNEKDRVFIHELLHAMWPPNICTGKVEEKLVTEISRTLAPILNNLLRTQHPDQITQKKRTNRSKRKIKESK